MCLAGEECGSFTDLIALPVRVLGMRCFLLAHDPRDAFVHRLTASSAPAVVDGVVACVSGDPRPDLRLGDHVVARIGG